MTGWTYGKDAVAARETALIRGEESSYEVPLSVLERHRIAPERWEQIVAEMCERGATEDLPVETPRYELTLEALASFQLSPEERAALEARYAATGGGSGTSRFDHLPIRGYTGYAWDTFFGGFARDRKGHIVYIGVFPEYRASSNSGPSPGPR
jgi:hypothetical protein